jgi:dGTPase
MPVAPPLARLRFDVERSRGRRYPEPSDPYRDPFVRDRHRTVHARAFRRMVDKTQVFASGLSDHVRNRLTHTLEVAQISHSVATALGLNETLAETLALAHDIGHPPFAHAGEEELNRQMARFGEGFDHNQHGLRIVEQFESRYARFPGLNLTFEVREGIVKHSRDFAPGEVPAFDEYLTGFRPPLEAQLIDLCDEIAYNTADLDDAYGAGLVAIDATREAVPEFDRLWTKIAAQFPDAPERVRMHEVVRALISHLVMGLIEGTVSAAGHLHDVEGVRNEPVRVCRFAPESHYTDLQLKLFLRKHVYEAPQLVEDRRRSTARIADLFAHFLAHPGDLPASYRESMAQQPAHRVVCDYIAGMTDGFLNRSWQQLAVSSQAPSIQAPSMR